MCTYTHTCTHTHIHVHTHTHHGQSVIHASTSMLCYFNLFYFLVVDPRANIVFSCHPIHHMFLFCISIGAVPLSKLSCVSMCTFMHAHTYTPHTSTSIHLQLRSHVYCLCKFVFPCSGNYQQVFLLPFALLNIMHAHAHTHTCTQTHMHMHAHSCIHTGVTLQSQTCAYVHIKMALAVIHHNTHTCTHTHTHTQNWPLLCIISLLSLVAMSTLTRCEPALQECTLMHTGMHAQTHTLKQKKQANKKTNKHAHSHKKTNTHIHKCKPPTLHSAWYTHTCTSTIRAC